MEPIRLLWEHFEVTLHFRYFPQTISAIMKTYVTTLIFLSLQFLKGRFITFPAFF